MDQKRRKLNQAREDLDILLKLILEEPPYEHKWNRLIGSIAAKQQDIKRLEKL